MTEEFNESVCSEDVSQHGVTVGLFDIPKETANAICKGISDATGAKVDWYYHAGRVHIKAVPAGASACTKPEVVEESLKTIVDHAAQAGYVVTVAQKPLKPLAMGHTEAVIEVRPSRKTGYTASW